MGVMAHTCNLSYLGGRDLKDHDLRPVWSKSSQDPISINKNLGMVVLACHLSSPGNISMKIVVQSCPEINAGLHLTNTYKLKRLGIWLFLCWVFLR
jgi:hypothetical protein